jgi:hypothetical protein
MKAGAHRIGLDGGSREEITPEDEAQARKIIANRIRRASNDRARG